MSIELINKRFENVSELDIHGKVALTFLDPPDNQGLRYDNCHDKESVERYSWLMEEWIIRSCSLTYGPVFVSFAEKWIGLVEQIIREEDIQLVQRLWWTYSFGQAHQKRYSPCVRPIYWLNDPTIYPDNIKIASARQKIYNDKRAAKGGKMPSNVWDFSRVCGTFKEKRKWHVTQHPEALMKRIVLGHSLPHDTVLDSFIGSGTTAYVCDENNRNCIGVDSSQNYLDKIREEIYERRASRV